MSGLPARWIFSGCSGGGIIACRPVPAIPCIKARAVDLPAPLQVRPPERFVFAAGGAADIYFADVQAPVVTHFGLTGPSRGITGAVVQFNEDMDRASAENLDNYQLTGFNEEGDKTRIPFMFASYDPARRNVTLTAPAFPQTLFQRLTFKAKANPNTGLKDAAGNLAGGGHLDALAPIATDAVSRQSRALMQPQFWILDPIALQTTILGTVRTKPKSDGIVVISEIIGLDKKELTDFMRNPAFRVNTLTFSSNATGL